MALCDRIEAGLAASDGIRSRLLESLLHDALRPFNCEYEVRDHQVFRVTRHEVRWSREGNSRVRRVQLRSWTTAACGRRLPVHAGDGVDPEPDATASMTAR